MAHSSRSYDVKLAPSKALKHADFDRGQQKTLKTPKRKNNLFTRPCQISQNYLLDISLNMNLNTGPRKCPRKTFSFDTYNFIPYHLIWSVSKVPCPSILQRRRNKKPVALESIELKLYLVDVVHDFHFNPSRYRLEELGFICFISM